MPAIYYGVNHRRSPLRGRRSLTAGGGRFLPLLQSLLYIPGADGGFPPSTCNRTEVSWSARQADDLGPALRAPSARGKALRGRRFCAPGRLGDRIPEHPL